MTMPAGWFRWFAYALRDRRVRLTITIDAVLLMLLLATILLYWWPQVSAQRQLHGQIEESRRALVIALQASDIAKAHAEAARVTKAVDEKLRAPVKQAQLVQGLAMLARTHGVRIVSESYEEGKRQTDYAPLFLQVMVEGKYGGIRGFLSDLSTLPLWLEAEELRLERLRESSSVLRAQVRLRAIRPAALPVVSGS